MLDHSNFTSLTSSPSDSHPYVPGRPFSLRSSSVPLSPEGLVMPHLRSTIQRRARFFACHDSPPIFLLILLDPTSPDPPHGDPHRFLGCTEAEASPLHELPSLSVTLHHPSPTSLFLSTAIPNRVVTSLKENVPWILPLLIPRRLPSSLRSSPPSSPPSLSLWVRLL